MGRRARSKAAVRLDCRTPSLKRGGSRRDQRPNPTLKLRAAENLEPNPRLNLRVVYESAAVQNIGAVQATLTYPFSPIYGHIESTKETK